MKPTLMKCGCAPNATSGGEPICSIHREATPMPESEVPDFSTREAKCSYCNRIEASDPKMLAFYEYRKGEEFDRYYCGCLGWN
jgi:hypothetical protein